MSIIDSVVFGIKGAFLNLRMPLLVITHNLITGEDEIDLKDENITTNKCFDMKGFPIMCTIGEVNFKI